MTIALALFVIGVICIVAEMFTGTLALLGLGVSFVLASCTQYFFENEWVSLLTFVIGVVLSLYIAKNYRKNPHEETASGVYALIGRNLRVIEVSVDNPYEGTVSVNGEYWTIKSEYSLMIGDEVVVHDIKGATLYVNKL